VNPLYAPWFQGVFDVGRKGLFKKDKKEQYESQVHFTPGKE
jgi:hypothetical protein